MVVVFTENCNHRHVQSFPSNTWQAHQEFDLYFPCTNQPIKSPWSFRLDAGSLSYLTTWLQIWRDSPNSSRNPVENLWSATMLCDSPIQLFYQCILQIILSLIIRDNIPLLSTGLTLRLFCFYIVDNRSFPRIYCRDLLWMYLCTLP